MEDFLGTSIQYSEQQILKLEKEYAEQQEAEIQQIIDSGFLDSDYEDTDTESVLTESEEKELLSLDYVSSDDSSLSTPPSPLPSSTTFSSSLSPSSPPSSSSSPHDMSPLAVILASDFSAVDVSTLHSAETALENEVNDANVLTDTGDDDDHHDISHLFSTDLKLMILFILAMIIPELMPNCVCHQQQHATTASTPTRSRSGDHRDSSNSNPWARYCHIQTSTMRLQQEARKDEDERECEYNDNESDPSCRSFKRLFSIHFPFVQRFTVFDAMQRNDRNCQCENQNQNQENGNIKRRKLFDLEFLDAFVIEKHDLFISHDALTIKKGMFLSQIGQIVVDISPLPSSASSFSAMHIGKETMIDPVGTRILERKVMTWSSVVLSLFSTLYAANTLSLPLPL